MKRMLLLIAVVMALLVPMVMNSQTGYAAGIDNGTDINNGNSNIDSICGMGVSNSSYCHETDTPTNRIYGKGGVIVITSYIIASIAGVAAVIMIVIGGIRFMVSGGDPNQVAGARNSIIFALVGLVVIAAAETLFLFVINSV
ncbi:MAG TPA: pilin [Candidatus Saccharimonadales bacterium]|jgi:hypothetical protein|nr:pilin [Candidatus Saccharimonadales bacterium]